MFPDLEQIKDAFPNVDPSIIGHDMAYPAMLTHLPTGVLGLVVASLIAAYMSTMSTSLNWGSSYVVNDFYKRFLKPESTEKELVQVGRISTVLMMIIASFFALYLESAMQAFNVLLQIGAGTGLLFILRWFWWRINAYSELTGMVVSFILAVFFLILHNMDTTQIELLVNQGTERAAAISQVRPLKTFEELIIGVTITTTLSLLVTFLTKPADEKTLINFYKLVYPGGPGWAKIITSAEKQGIAFTDEQKKSELPLGILSMFVGCIAVYGLLMAIGFWIYSNYLPAIILTVVTIIASFILFKLWGKLNKK